MAVDTFSDQYAKLEAIPPENVPVHDWRGRVRMMYFKDTLAVEHQANSTIKLVRMPQGKVRILPQLSLFYTADDSDGITMDLGTGAYTKLDGTAQVAIADNLLDGIAAGGAVAPGIRFNAPEALPSLLVESADGFDIILTILTDSAQANKVFEGWVAYVLD